MGRPDFMQTLEQIERASREHQTALRRAKIAGMLISAGGAMATIGAVVLQIELKRRK